MYNGTIDDWSHLGDAYKCTVHTILLTIIDYRAIGIEKIPLFIWIFFVNTSQPSTPIRAKSIVCLSFSERLDPTLTNNYRRVLDYRQNDRTTQTDHVMTIPLISSQNGLTFINICISYKRGRSNIENQWDNTQKLEPQTILVSDCTQQGIYF